MRNMTIENFENVIAMQFKNIVQLRMNKRRIKKD